MHDARYDSAFLKACRGEPTDYTPIWLHRQAGRYMPEYHQVKGNTDSLSFFKTSEQAARVTCDAQRILGVDAAIMFADLLPIVEPMGLSLEYLPGVGPNIGNPVRTGADIDAIAVTEARDSMPYIGETIRLIREELPADIPVIGFAGAPFTLASYMIEGKSSRNYTHAKRMMYADTGAWNELLGRITDIVIDYLNYQIDCGVDAVEIFDSWVGCLSCADYVQYVQPHSRRLLENVSGRAPVIHFGTGNPALTPLMADAGGDVIALDWRARISESWQAFPERSVQGNLDPIALCADRDTVHRQAKAILDEVEGRPGHIFNLGHGIIPETPVDNVRALVDFVHEYSPGTRSG